MSSPTGDEQRRIRYLKMVVMRCSHLYYYPAEGREEPPEDYIFDALERELQYYYDRYPIYFPDGCVQLQGAPGGLADRGALAFEEDLRANPVLLENLGPLNIVVNSEFIR